MIRKLTTLFIAASLMLTIANPIHALRITDSSTSDRGARSTFASLNKLNTISTYGYQNSYGIPVGMIVAWSSKGGINTPDKMKWLECNGQEFDTNMYPELYEVLGVNRVPNLNNQFLRGTMNAENFLKEYNDMIGEHHSKITETNLTAKLDFTDITTELKNTRLTATLNNRAITSNLTNTKLTSKLNSTSITTTAKQIDNVSMSLSGAKASGTVSGKTQGGSISGTAGKQNFTATVSVSGTNVVKRNSGVHSYADTIKHNDWSSPFYTIIRNSNSGTVSGSTDGGTISGTAAAQTFTSDRATWDVTGNAKGNISIPSLSGTVANSGQATGNLTSGYATGTVTNGTSSGNLVSGQATGTVTNGNVHGTLDSDDVYYEGVVNPYSGRNETAPMHTFVRYFIKAIP